MRPSRHCSRRPSPSRADVTAPPTAQSFLDPDPYLDGPKVPEDGAGNVTVPPDPVPTEYGDDLDVPDFLR